MAQATTTIMNDDDAICIVGIGCRYPGDLGGVEGFWDTISKARSTHSEVPKERWDPDVFYHPNHERAGSINTRGGYFLKNGVSHFDAPFFSITAHEAAGMDPQQRLLLELAYETFENAGVNIGHLKGSRTGCYVGSFSNDYSDQTNRDLNDMHPYASTGNGKSMLSNRVSWFYDLRGPSFTIDTACSSSMYAFHLACQSIRLGETDMGLVGGSNIIVSPAAMRSLTYMRFLSPTGKCHSYDQSADGYARGEGVGMILLKRLSKAIADGDTIRAIVRNSGVNQDGKTPGITMPSAAAQAALIRQCYQESGLSMDETAYFEGHGTGTLLGDPIELSALGATFGNSRTMENPLYVGSVKANIGHQEGGAGLAGIIRAVLALEKGVIPPNAELEKPNAAFKLEEWKVVLPTEALPWPTSGVRRISINSFGYGGANSHAIIQDAASYLLQHGLEGNHSTDVSGTLAAYESDSDSGFGSQPVTPDLSEDIPVMAGIKRALFSFSASDQAALGRMLPCYIDFLQKRLESSKQDGSDLSSMMSDMAFTLASRRTTFDHRAAFAAGSIDELIEQIQATPAPKTKKAKKSENIAFIFTGQGAQYAAMGRELLAYDVFRQSLEHSQNVLSGLGCEWDLVEELLKDDSETRVNLPSFSQPLCTAIQIAQVALLASWGVHPKATVGHSSGEIGAAFSSGKLSHDDAMNIAYHRGLFSDRVNARQEPKRGAMLAVGLGAEEAEPYLAKINATNPETPAIVIACINSPKSVTISGDYDSIRTLQAQLTAESVFARGLKTSDTAYHSPHMKLIADDYLDSMKEVAPLTSNKSDIRMFSSVSGSLVENAADLGPSYWVANMLQPVRFSEALHSMLNYSANPRKRRRPGAEFTALVELGPSAALKGPIQQVLAVEDAKLVANIVYTSFMQRGQEADACALNAAAKLWAQGTAIDFNAINQHLHAKHPPKVQSDLPAYVWNHASRMWHDTTSNALFMKEPRTDLLGHISGLRNMNAPIWHNMIRMGETPWLADHKIHTSIIYPGTSMIVMALEAAQKQVERGRVAKGYQFRDISLPKALPIPADGSKVEVQMYVKPLRLGTRTQDSSWYEFSFVSLDDQKQWTENCFGQFKIIYNTEASEVDGGLQANTDWAQKKEEYAKVKQRMYQEIPKRAFYKGLHGIGMNYGPTFQGVETLYVGDEGGCHSVIAIPDTASVMPHKFEHQHLIHPATLDAITQTLFGTMIKSKAKKLKTDGAQVPVNIGKLYIAADLPSGAGAKYVGYTHSCKKNPREYIGQIVMSDETWSEPKIIYEDFVTMGLNQVMAGQSSGAVVRKKCAAVQWTQDLRYSAPDVTSLTDSTATPAIGDDWSAEIVELVLRTLDELRDQRLPTEHLEHFYRWADAGFGHLQVPEQSPHLDVNEALDEFPERLGNLVSSGKDFSEALTDEFYEAFATSVGKPVLDYTALDAWLQMVYLNNPNASVLLIGDGSSSSAASHVAKTHIARAGHTDCLQSCVLAEVNEDSVLRTKAALEADKIQAQYTTYDPSKDSILSGVKTQTFDLIVAPPNLAFTDLALANLKSIMSANGILLLSGSQQTRTPSTFLSALSETWWNANMAQLVNSDTIDADQDRWSYRIQASGIEASVHTNVRAGNITIGVVPQETTASLLGRHLDGRNVVLIQPEGAATASAAKFQEILTQQLLDAKCTVAVAKLGDQEAIAGQMVICLAELSEDLIATMDEETFTALKDTVVSASQLVWLTRSGVHLDGEDAAALNLNQTLTTGLLRSIRSEYARTVNIHLDLSSQTDLTSSQTVQRVLHVITNELFNLQPEDSMKVADHDREIAMHGNKIFVPRVTWDDSFNLELAIPHRQDFASQEPLYQEDRILQYVVGTTGRLDSLHWVDDRFNPDYIKSGIAGDIWVEIKIMAWSLNFMDIMAAMGQIPTETLGLEIAGEVVRVGPGCTRLKPGMRVALPKKPSFITKILTKETDCEVIPDDMDFATAASLPVVYMTAYVGLIVQGRLAKGETILIHAAVGGVGQAVLQMARWIGADIYVTVGSQRKKELLMDHYGIPEERIFSSRDLSFAEGIMRATNGKGVDVVVNSLSGEALRVTWNCIAFGGRFVEVGKRDILGNTGLDMAPFLRQVTFTSVNLEAWEEVDPDGFQKTWHDVWALIAQGFVGPVYPVNKYGVSDAEKAFRFMASGAHMGKVVVTAENIGQALDAKTIAEDHASTDLNIGTEAGPKEILVPVMPPKPLEVALDPSATYVLCGGLGGIGRSTALMMADHGAKHLVFLSRSGATKTEHFNLLKDLDLAGVRADALVCDAIDRSAVSGFAELCKENDWKVKGVVQCAMVLRDRMFENMTHEDWTLATAAKVQGTKNLSDLLPTDMDFFIMLSSLSGVIGNPGQANYSAANTYMDALAQWRRSQGMAAIAIDLGVVADVGYLAENPDGMDAYASMAPLHITESDLLQLLSASMKGHTIDARPLPAQVIAGFGKEFLTAGGSWANDKKFSHALSSNDSLENTDAESSALREAMASSPSIRDAGREVQDALLGRLGRALMLEASDIDASKPLHAYGVDSLVAVEIRNWVFRELAADVTVFDIMSPMPIHLLALKIASISGLLPKAVIAEQIEEVTKELAAAVPAP